MMSCDCLNSFEKQTFVVFNSYDVAAYNSLKDIVVEALVSTAQSQFNVKLQDLEHLHHVIPLDCINDFRIEAYRQINRSALSDLLYSVQSPLLDQLLGPDLAIQKLVNLSIVPPNDLSSTIPFHSDINTGESLYELVSWIPFTDCTGSNSIFLADPKESLQLHKNLGSFNSINSISITQHVKDSLTLTYLNIKKTECLLFSPILFHGSTINKTSTTRVSINLRFKNLFSPYTHHDCEGKGLNDFFTILKKSKLSSFVDLYTPPDFS